LLRFRFEEDTDFSMYTPEEVSAGSPTPSTALWTEDRVTTTVASIP
jgi:hypothetical protein